VATAMRLVAALNADVKGAAADANYALEAAVRKVAELAAGDYAGREARGGGTPSRGAARGRAGRLDRADPGR